MPAVALIWITELSVVPAAQIVFLSSYCCNLLAIVSGAMWTYFGWILWDANQYYFPPMGEVALVGDWAVKSTVFKHQTLGSATLLLTSG